MEFPNLKDLGLLEKGISFYTEDIIFELSESQKIAHWIAKTIKEEGFDYTQIDCIFCSDSYLHEINVEHLQHDTYTDIITFDYTENKVISGDLFISIDRVQENAQNLKVFFLKELHRVIIHGILHLCGYSDHQVEDEQIMRGKEDFYLQKLSLCYLK